MVEVYYARHRGNLEAALAFAHGAFQSATVMRQPLSILSAHRLLGELAIESGHLDEAAAHLSAAVALAEACATPFERSLALLALAALRGVLGDHADARRMLAEVRSICEPLSAQPTLARVAVLEQELVAAR